ncbi:hypothetical protein ACWGJX_42985 [Streptomyces sp. NPDC054775]
MIHQRLQVLLAEECRQIEDDDVCLTLSGETGGEYGRAGAVWAGGVHQPDVANGSRF